MIFSTKNKHFFPEFEEASALSTNAKSKIFAYKQKSKRKQFKNKKKNSKNKKSKFGIFKKANLSEDVENDDFYERGSLKDKHKKLKNAQDIDNDLDEDDDDDFDDDGHSSSFRNGTTYFDENNDSNDNESGTDIEPSMHSIPEHDDHIETLIGHNDYEPSVSSQLLAPHWTPSGLTATGGHHNRDFSHNLNESGYADNDSDSDPIDYLKQQKQNSSLSPGDDTNGNNNNLNGDVTPPISDADIPVSPYYDDTPLMDGKGSQHLSAFDNIITTSISPKLTPKNSLELRPQNSLNMGEALDAMEAEIRLQSQQQYQAVSPNQLLFNDDLLYNNGSGSDSDPSNNNGNNINKEKAPTTSRQSSLLRPIAENEDTDDETSANDTDAQTAYEHMRNLSTHIEDQEYGTLIPSDNPSGYDNDQDYDDDDDEEDNTNYLYDTASTPVTDNNNNTQFVNMKININATRSNNNNNNNNNDSDNDDRLIAIDRTQSHDSPGNTPPPVSPRYKKMSNAHKRKLSDKLDSFLHHRQNPQQLIKKRILYVTPEADIQSVKEKIQIKREERDKIKNRLKRKLSHDFRPTEQDIEERGIKLVPDVIREYEEDVDEEIIVYDNINDRNSFSLHKKKSLDFGKKSSLIADVIEATSPLTPEIKEEETLEVQTTVYDTNINNRNNSGNDKNIQNNKVKRRENKTRDSISSIESADFAYILQKKRQRNSKKIEQALVERPTPSDIIEKGYIAADQVNANIPARDSFEELTRLKAELNLITITHNNYKIEKEKVKLRTRRRSKILTFYDTYLFNTMLDDDTDDDEDDDDDKNNYNNKYPLVEKYVDIESDYQIVINKVQNEHQRYNRNDKLFSNENIFDELYDIGQEEISLEKEWMRNLRRRKFRSYMNKNKYKMIQDKKNIVSTKLEELNEQIEIIENRDKIDSMTVEIKQLEQKRIVLIENTSKQIDSLRDIIKNLNKLYSKKNSFISISSH